MIKTFFCACLVFFCIQGLPVDANAQTKSKKKTEKRANKQKSVKKKPATRKIVRTKPQTTSDGKGKFVLKNTLQRNDDLAQELIKNPAAIKSLDSFLNAMVRIGAFPGCQVIAVKNGTIIYQNNVGHTTYGKEQAVSDSTLYDIASVSKLVATTLAVMKLYEEDKISLEAYVKNYVPFLENTPLANLTLRNILLHQAGLKSYIPFHKTLLDSVTGAPSTKWFHTHKGGLYTIPVASNFFMNRNYIDSMWAQIINTPLQGNKYVYSDLDFYLLAEVVKNESRIPLDSFVYQHFYKPMGLTNTAYNPWKLGWTNRCAPTENDDYFRFQTIKGYVHDPGTAMLGGVAGHAGVFSNVYELAKIMQMLLNGGEYGGKRYFKKETIQLFTSYQSSISRRGLGFDKPDKAVDDGGPAATSCSKTSFGHQGFTGTCAWSDPTNNVTFIFLSNRIHPSASNRLIGTYSIRTEAQEYIYKALGINSK